MFRIKEKYSCSYVTRVYMLLDWNIKQKKNVGKLFFAHCTNYYYYHYYCNMLHKSVVTYFVSLNLLCSSVCVLVRDNWNTSRFAEKPFCFDSCLPEWKQKKKKNPHKTVLRAQFIVSSDNYTLEYIPRRRYRDVTMLLLNAASYIFCVTDPRWILY